MTPPRIAFLGTGLMGAPMARNLLRAGYDLRVWNRTRAKAGPLAADGATLCLTAAEAVEGADVVISMLTDGDAVFATLSNPTLLSALKEGAVWIDMSSAKPADAERQSAALIEKNCHHLDAPVSGGTLGAEAATLAIMVGGKRPVFEAVEMLLGVLGRPVLVGPAGSGQLAKLANQAIVGVTISAVAEAMLLLEAGGADPAAVRQALKGGFADSTVLQLHGARMTDRDFTPGGLAGIQLKDLNNILSVAGDLGLSLPNTAAVKERFETLCSDPERASMDHAALFLELLDRNTAP